MLLSPKEFLLLERVILAVVNKSKRSYNQQVSLEDIIKNCKSMTKMLLC